MRLRLRPSNADALWTADAVRHRLTAGEAPRHRGGADAEAGWPPHGQGDMSDFEAETARRARQLAREVEAEAHREVAVLTEAARADPVAGAVTRLDEEALRAPDAFVETVSARLTPEVAPLMAAADDVEARDRAWRRDLQAAGATAPRDGWKSVGSFFPRLVLLFALETGVATLTLKHSLDWGPAATQGAGMALISMVLGAGAAFLALRPAHLNEIASPFRVARLTAAIGAGVVLLGMIYAMAANRAALLDGQDATSAQIIAAMGHPGLLAVHWEAWVLAILSLAGFGVAAWETHHFFHGHAPALRASGRAAERAQTERQAYRDGLVDWTAAEAEGARSRLDQMVALADTWRAHCDRRAEAAVAALRTAGHRLALVNEGLQDVWSGYRRGHFEVRAARTGRPEGPAPPAVSAPLPVIDDLIDAHDAARAGAARLAPIVRQAQAEISRRRDVAIDRIDILAGLRPSPAAPPLAAQPLNVLAGVAP
jgi:hypothetical protein